MPVLESTKKALRNAQRKAKSNLVIRENYKEALKKARKNPNEENIKKAYSLLDKAAKTNVIHKNKASRLKSRLVKLATKKTPQEETKKQTRKKTQTKDKTPKKPQKIASKN